MNAPKSLIYYLSIVAFSASCFAANPLIDAANIQNQLKNRELAQKSKEQNQEETKIKMNTILQFLFQKYYAEVKKSAIKLANAQHEVDNLNLQRRRTGGCCDIHVSTRSEGGMYLTTTDGDGLFVIEGYGLQSVSGEIQDTNFNQTGVISSNCKYEVSISYNNSRNYNCSAFLSRKLDKQVVSDMLEMLPSAMKAYVK